MYWHALGFPFFYGFLPPIVEGFAGPWGYWIVFLGMTYRWWFGKGGAQRKSLYNTLGSSDVVRIWIWVMGALVIGIMVGTIIEMELIAPVFQGGVVNGR